MDFREDFPHLGKQRMMQVMLINGPFIDASEASRGAVSERRPDTGQI
jgi:hypothetical protein